MSDSSIIALEHKVPRYVHKAVRMGEIKLHLNDETIYEAP